MSNESKIVEDAEPITMPSGWRKVGFDIVCEDTGYVLKNANIPEPFGWRVYVLPDPILTKTKSGIILPDEAKHAEGYYKSTGRIVAMGSNTYADKLTGQKFKGNWPDVGDRVVYGRYSGKPVHVDGVKLHLVDDVNISSGVPEDAVVQSYVNDHVAHNTIS